MKLGIESLPINDAVAVVQDAQQNKELKRLANYTRKIDGGTIFCFNTKTRELKPCLVLRSDVFVTDGENRERVDIEPGCIYVEAMNKKNALKRIEAGKIIIAT